MRLRVVTFLVSTALASCTLDDYPKDPTSPVFAAGDGAVVLVGAGQIARCDRTFDEATAVLLDGVAGTVFTLGDNVYTDGSRGEFDSCYEPTWGRHRARTRPAAGDIEHQTAGAAGYFEYFGTAAGPSGQGYYSYDQGVWHIVVLNSNVSTSAGSAQEQWLRADLAASSAQCTLAYWHHPRFSSAGTAVRSSLKPLWDALYAAGVEVVLNSHYRVFERFGPQTPDEIADPGYGIRQFTVGTGGHGTGSIGTIRPNSEVRSGSAIGVLKLTLDEGEYEWQFVPAAGWSFTDAGRGTCHGPRPPGGTTVDRVEVSPATASVASGETVSLSAVALDALGNPLADQLTSWASGDATVATVNGSGTVTGVGSGVAVITATIDGQSGSTIVTVTPPETPWPTLVGAGDIADCSESADDATARVLDNIGGTVFTVGDNVYPDGTAAEFTDCYQPTWGRHRARTRPAPGNHDYHTAGAAGYFEYFGPAAGDPAKGYYSYDIGDWHVISLNSSISMSAGSAQEQWLRADLAASAKQCTLAYWHHPRFSSGHHGSTTSARPLWQALYDAGAEIVVSGHDHLYERFAPQTPDGVPDSEGGIRQFTVGTGGADLYQFNATIANSEVRGNSAHGVLKLTLYADRYDWEFMPAGGATFTDEGSGFCHGPGVTPPPNQAPTAAFTRTCSGLTCGFTDQSADLDGVITAWNWSFGDGGTSTAQHPSWTYAGAGTYVVSLTVTDNGGSRGSAASAVSVSPAGANVLERRVAAGTDDAEESAAGSVSRGSSDLEMVFDGDNQTVGMRFTGVGVPAGATISSAYVQFQVDETNSVATSLTIWGEATDNAATFSSTSGNISSRRKTASSVSWEPPAWGTAGQAGDDQRTPNLAAIVQEIVNRQGWASGNSLAILITGTGERVAEAYDGVPAAAPLLHVDYTVGSNAAPTASNVAVTGTAQVGQVLTGTYTYADGDGDAEGTSAYRWLRGGAPISGATARTYALGTADQGALIVFEVTPVAATGTSPGAAVASAAVGPVVALSISLSARGYKVKGVQQVDLTWSGATGSTVDVYRNNARVTTTGNDGAHTDNIGKKGGGTYVYRVCNAGTTICSNDVSVVF